MSDAGMTLIEMAVVLAIIGILAAIGSASYISQSNTQRLYAMRAALVHLEAEQATQRLLTQRYTTSLPGVSDTRFTVEVISADSDDFTIKAISTANTGDVCDELVITSTSRSPERCWK